jgi:glycosyltransferase involved in cell wall biosynthesis
VGAEKWYLKGFCYGPFAPNSQTAYLPERVYWRNDLAQIRSLGANTVRLYHTPPSEFLDDALEAGLRVFIDVPWEKHRCFLEDWSSQEDARNRIRETARTMGVHPAVFAISVVNEFPNDVVRFHGHRRLERFVGELIDIVKQEAPDCLATFVNFPTTEFLEAPQADFSCFNVYLHDSESLGSYLDRLQHIAGNRPLVLGEYGICTIRCSEEEQATLLREQIRQVFRHGLAGSFVFSFTDDWFTGGHQIEDWAFGVTRLDRTPKTSAAPLKALWDSAPQVDNRDLPKVSVVVCSYNGASTLDECLGSLMRLNYPDYEVILVDDGSTDETPRIAKEYPQVITYRQPNRGLSAARNVGAEIARGEIVAYTDSDCVADEDWLYYLVQSLHDQGVDAIGGPNIPPPSDGWIARCVAVSPGGPSHVMLDDRLAEHVPGCNMAFRRADLLRLGGFDPQFRQAGDDVDFCWRWLDHGKSIGYAAAAMVWHHRRSTVSAYLKQQKGYGRAEAMVLLKHPHRSTELGYSLWKGIIYGEGAIGLPKLAPIIYHGRFGSAPFQAIYRQNCYGVWAWVITLEWQVAAAVVLCLGLLFPVTIWAALVMWLATLTGVLRLVRDAPLAKGAPWWCRPLVFGLYLVQPMIRGWHRHRHIVLSKRLNPLRDEYSQAECQIKRINARQIDLYWTSDVGLGRESLLDSLVEEAKKREWAGEFSNEWTSWDLGLNGDLWHDITIRTATEELGWPRRFTRARCSFHVSPYGRAALLAVGLWTLASALSGKLWAIGLAITASLGCLAALTLSRRRCASCVAALLWRVGTLVGLDPIFWKESGAREKAPLREHAISTAFHSPVHAKRREFDEASETSELSDPQLAMN